MTNFSTILKTVPAALLLSGGSAMAGGYVKPVVAAPYVPAQEAPKFNWSGAYVGLSAGRTDLDLKRDLTTETPITKDHPATYKDVPAVYEEKIIPAVTDTKHHPATYKDEPVPAVTEEIKEKKKAWVPTDPDKMFNGCHGGNFTCPVPVEGTGEWDKKGNWTGEWLHREEVVGIKVIEPATTKRVVDKEAWTETVIIEPERTVKVLKEKAKRVVDKEAWTEVVGTTFTTTALSMSEGIDTYGIFAGYRQQFTNNFVLGAEANYSMSDSITGIYEGVAYDFDMNTISIEGQVGYAMDRVLPYAGVGFASTGGHDALMVTAGIDYAVTDNLMLGVKLSHYKYDDFDGWEADANKIDIRVGWKF